MADSALVWFVASVTMLVRFQTRHLTEGFPADFALIRTSAFVCGHVQFEVRQLCVGFFALVTFVRFVAIVDVHVDFHTGHLVELFGAHFALELLSIDMNLQVSCQVTLLAIRLTANRAEERLLRGW